MFSSKVDSRGSFVECVVLHNPFLSVEHVLQSSNLSLIRSWRNIASLWRLKELGIRCVQWSGLASRKVRKRAETADTVVPKENQRGSDEEAVVEQLSSVPACENVLFAYTGCKAVCTVVP